MTYKSAYQEHGMKYGTFEIIDGVGYWNRDANVQVKMEKSGCKHCQMEGFWNPHNHEIKFEYATAISGLCIWGKYDCVFSFKPNARHNPGAERSLGNPRDREDLFKRIAVGQRIQHIILSKEPFGLYQLNLIKWQAYTVRRFNIQKLYYSLPIDEYSVTIRALEPFLPDQCIDQLIHVLISHHRQLKEKIINTIDTKIEFINPMQDNKAMSAEQSYRWPYQNLKIDLGLEEMEEICIPYQAAKTGAIVPPIFLGLLGFPSPYYDRRRYKSESDFYCLIPESYH